MTSPSPERNGSPSNSPSGDTIAVKRAAGDRADRASRIRHDLRLLIGIQPTGGVDDEAARFEGVIADADLGLLGEEWSAERAGPHGRVDLLPVGDQRVAEERVVVLPARQLADSSDGAVDGRRPERVALTPDHPFVIGRRDLATPLKQRAVGVEQQLRVVQGAAVTFVDADGHHDSGRPGRIGDGVGRADGMVTAWSSRLRCSLTELEGSLQKREVRVVRHDRLGESRELHTSVAEFGDLGDDLLDGAVAAVEHRTDLYRCGFDDSHGFHLSQNPDLTRSKRTTRGPIPEFSNLYPGSPGIHEWPRSKRSKWPTYPGQSRASVGGRQELIEVRQKRRRDGQEDLSGRGHWCHRQPTRTAVGQRRSHRRRDDEIGGQGGRAVFTRCRADRLRRFRPRRPDRGRQVVLA